MNCNNKTILIVVLILITLFLFFSWRKEFFNFNDYKKKLEIKPL
jgi:hypothetical protein